MTTNKPGTRNRPGKGGMRTIRVGPPGDLREIAVWIPEGDVPPYDPDETLRVMGQPLPRLEARAKVTGKALYTHDRKLPEMLHGCILRSPHANADVRGVDFSRLRGMPGVRGTISLVHVFHRASVLHAGDAVAAVAAETEEQARRACEAIRVEYDVHPFCVTREAALVDTAPRVGRGNQRNLVRIHPPEAFGPEGLDAPEEERRRQVLARRAADTDTLLGSLAHQVSGTFETQTQTHSCLETHGVLCHWEEDRLVCYASTQATFGLRDELTRAWGPVGAPQAQVICEHMGGGFGSKFTLGKEGVAAALLAARTGAPVRLVLDRREEQTSTGNRPDSHQRITLGLDASGKIQGARIRSWGTSGSNPRGAGVHNDQIYDLGQLVDKVDHGVRTNTDPSRIQRAPGWPQGMFALERIMEEAAIATGQDAIEFRKRHDPHPLRRLQYDLARERIEWDRYRDDRTARDGWVRGVGCAAAQWYARGGGGARVLVRIHRNGQVEVRCGGQDVGTGTRTILGMVVAEELGIDLERVTVHLGNTDDPVAPGSGGSTTAATLTPAGRLAAVRARMELDAVVTSAGRDPSSLSFGEACQLMQEDAIEVLADRPIVDRDQPNYGGHVSTNAGFQCARVAVDPELGQVRVEKIVAIQDAGKIINPLLAESQVRGGVIQGIGFALHERRVMDRQEGRMLNPDLEMYRVPGSLETPEIDVVIPDVYMGHNNTHVMGLGEPPIVATAAAIANAVRNALGRPVNHLPITPKTLL